MQVKIVPYDEKFRSYYKSLNAEWIDQYFYMEEEDISKLNNPESIIAKGGAIHFAIADGIPVGVCSLVKLNEHTYDYELSKMGVTESHQGKGIGRKLAVSIINEAKAKGGQSLFLESNTVLNPAITLYKSLGFIELPFTPSIYSRSNIQMLLKLG